MNASNGISIPSRSNSNRDSAGAAHGLSSSPPSSLQNWGVLQFFKERVISAGKSEEPSYSATSPTLGPRRPRGMSATDQENFIQDQLTSGWSWFTFAPSKVNQTFGSTCVNKNKVDMRKGHCTDALVLRRQTFLPWKCKAIDDR